MPIASDYESTSAQAGADALLLLDCQNTAQKLVTVASTAK